MEPLKNLIERAWESLTEGWRELLTRSSGALTHFGTEDTGKDESAQEFPHWSLLAAETWETALSVVIRLEIPGMNEHDLAVDIHGNILRIRGEKRSGAAQEGRRYQAIKPERKTTCLRIRYPNLHCQLKTTSALLCATILRRQR
jgi:HSP20 family protein